MLTIIGHTDHTLRYHPRGIGEMANTSLLAKRTGAPVLDLYELLGERKTMLRLARANLLHCAQYDKPLDLPPSITLPPSSFLLMTPVGGLAALLATGATRSHPTIARVHAFHPDTPLHAPLYDQVDLVIAQSPLSMKVAIDQGIPPHKLLFLPYQLPDKLPPKTSGDQLVVGCSTRFEYRRNVEFLIWAFEKAALPGAKLVLRGDVDPISDVLQGEGYTQRLKKVLTYAQTKPWFEWDRERTSYAEHLRRLARFDLHVHLGGSDDPANAVIEAMGIGVPNLLLRCNRPHSLFEGGVAWTPNTGPSHMRQGSIPFFLPNTDALATNLTRLLGDKAERERLAAAGQTLVRSTLAFCPQRLDLALRAARAYHHKTADAASLRDEILATHAFHPYLSSL